jgi:hypothetical protein
MDGLDGMEDAQWMCWMDGWRWMDGWTEDFRWMGWMEDVQSTGWKEAGVGWKTFYGRVGWRLNFDGRSDGGHSRGLVGWRKFNEVRWLSALPATALPRTFPPVTRFRRLDGRRSALYAESVSEGTTGNRALAADSNHSRASRMGYSLLSVAATGWLPSVIHFID